MKLQMYYNNDLKSNFTDCLTLVVSDRKEKNGFIASKT